MGHKTAKSLFSLLAGTALASQAALAQDPGRVAESEIFDLDHPYAAYISGLQERFGDAAHQPVIVIDREWFDFNKAYHDADRLRGVNGRLMQHFIHDRAGQDVPDLMAEMFSRELDVPTGQALPHGYLNQRYWHSSDNSGPFCLLYPASPLMDAEFQTRIVIDYRPEIYGALYGPPLNPVLSYDEQIKLVDYHELVHCMDDLYMGAYLRGEVEGTANFLDNRHRMELKAELLAVLLMVKYEGATDLAERRAAERYLDSWFRGRDTARSAWDPASAMTGASYAFGPGLERLQEEINERGVDVIRAMKFEELTALAVDLTEEMALSRAQRNALRAAYDDPAQALAHDDHGAFTSFYLQRVAQSYQRLTGTDLAADSIADIIISDQPPGGGDPFQQDLLRPADAAEKNRISARLAKALKSFQAGQGYDLAQAFSTMRAMYMDIISDDSAGKDKRLQAMREAALLPKAVQIIRAEEQEITAQQRAVTAPAANTPL